MKAVSFYLTKSIMYLIGLLPFRALHVIADMLLPVVWHVIRYRKDVILINLRHAFPEKSEKEREQIAIDFYRHFLDMTLETFKGQSITRQQVKKHVRYVEQEVGERIAGQGRSAILLMPHYNNWELFGQRISMQKLFVFRPVYKPLHNKYFDRMMYDVRSRFGSEPMEIGNVLRKMIRDGNRLTLTAFVVDQKPLGDRILWVDFLNQRTPVFRGAYAIARRLNQPLIYLHLRRLKRGFYEAEFDLMTESPQDYSEQQLAEMFFERLERDIRSEPQYWLWSHRRWRRGPNNIYEQREPVQVASEA